MEAIKEGMDGVAVEDVQDRLVSLGYQVGAAERDAKHFGPSTAEQVARFRLDHGLPMGTEVDLATWSELVDEGYHMGDRTLYLRLPNFHGNDVRTLQTALSILGFSCGEIDGSFGAHTEAAVKQFQDNVGMLADGICFQDTFQAIWRLYHVWGAKEAQVPTTTSPAMGFARAASVLEETRVTVFADDPISRTVAGRIWNLASATSENSGLTLVNGPDEVPADATAVLELMCDEPAVSPGVTSVHMDRCGDDLPRRLRTSVAASRHKPPFVRIQLPGDVNGYDGSFTNNRAQMMAGTLLDAICSAFSEA